jgi:serine/threonine protein kinase/Tfp pilus assembly protein PilF
MSNNHYQQCPHCFSQNIITTKKCCYCELKFTSIKPAITRKVKPVLVANASANNHSTKQQQPSLQANFLTCSDALVNFSIIDVIGKGGMGTVYKANDCKLERNVALKLMHLTPHADPITAVIKTDSLLDEARMVCKLNHANIVIVHDVVPHKNDHCIVMEWIDGLPLSEMIPAEGLPLAKALAYACQISNGIAFAHEHGIIHQDIKPQNIMVNQQDKIKILDFGIASLVKNQANGSELNVIDNNGSLHNGTLHYMAPEQLEGKPLSPHIDIFSFGIVLYQMLCGHHPFYNHASSTLGYGIEQNILKGQYTHISHYLPKLSPRITILLDKMLAYDKNKRWLNSAELSIEINAIYQEQIAYKNWWQRQHTLSKLAIILPLLSVLAWSINSVVFPISTQALIAQQVKQAKVIALLPFENISGDPLLQLFNDGLAVSLNSDLAEIGRTQGDAWIIPTSEIRKIKALSVQKISDKYGANLVISGSIQHMGSTRQLMVSLIDAKDGRQLKTLEIIIDANELFQGYNQIRSQILRLLDWHEPETLTAKFKDKKPEFDGAYKQYIYGTGYLYRSDQAGNLANAEQAFTDAIAIDKSYQSAYVGLATAQIRYFRLTKEQKWLDNVAITIESLRLLNPKHHLIDFLSAQLLIRTGKYTQAVTLLEEHIKAYPNYLESYTELAFAISKIGDIEKAENIYKVAIKLFPNNWLGRTHLGYFYHEHGLYLKAIEQYKQQLKTTPNNFYAYLNIAAEYYSIDKIEEAINYTKQAIQINPAGFAYSNLGTMYFYLKQYNKAISAYEKASTISDSNYLIWGNLADAYRFAHNNKSIDAYKKASDLATAALSTNPKDTMAIVMKAYYLANIGDKNTALKLLEKITIKNSGQENFLAATAYDLLEETSKALAHIKNALTKNYPVEEIKNSVLLNKVKKDQRFQQLLMSKNSS